MTETQAGELIEVGRMVARELGWIGIMLALLGIVVSARLYWEIRVGQINETLRRMRNEHKAKAGRNAPVAN